MLPWLTDGGSGAFRVLVNELVALDLVPDRCVDRQTTMPRGLARKLVVRRNSLSCMGIEIADYDPRWPALAAEAISELTDALPGAFVRIEHFGSTSVPGLAAKPVIDLMAGVTSLDFAVALADKLAALGYLAADNGMSGRLFFYRDHDGVRTHHLHVVPDESLDTRNEILLRDYLRRKPADAAQYGALKRDLAAHSSDGLAYTEAKTEFIQRIVDAARTERGLPLISVWER